MGRPTEAADLSRTLKAAEKLSAGITESIQLARQALADDLPDDPAVRVCLRRARRLCVTVERLLSGGIP